MKRPENEDCRLVDGGAKSVGHEKASALGLLRPFRSGMLGGDVLYDAPPGRSESLAESCILRSPLQ